MVNDNYAPTHLLEFLGSQLDLEYHSPVFVHGPVSQYRISYKGLHNTSLTRADLEARGFVIPWAVLMYCNFHRSLVHKRNSPREACGLAASEC